MLTLVEAPPVEPLTAADFETSLGIDSSDDAVSALLSALIKSTREQAETFSSRALITQTWKLNHDLFPDMAKYFISFERPLTGLTGGKIHIPIGPLQQISSVKYIDADGNQQTLDPSVYTVISGSEEAYIVPAYGQVWPVTRLVPNAVEVNFISGYGDDATDVPEMIKVAMKFVASHLYENPMPQADAQDAANAVFVNLLAGYRWFSRC